MNIVIYDKQTKDVVLAGELKGDFKPGQSSVSTPYVTLSNVNWDNLDWFITEDDFPEGFITQTQYEPSYSMKFNDLSLSDARLPLIKQMVKELASEKILAVAPEWKQRNMIATGLALLNKGKENWTTEEIEMVNTVNTTWAVIHSIREASNSIEVELDNDNNYDWKNSPLWPEV